MEASVILKEVMNKSKKEIVDKIVRRYNESQKKGDSSARYSITRKERVIFIEIDGEEYSIARQDLSDNPDGVGDNLANAIWTWIHP